MDRFFRVRVNFGGHLAETVKVAVSEHLGQDVSIREDPIASALGDLLDRHPEALVAGVEDSDSGHPTLVAPPAFMGLPAESAASGPMLIDHVVASDRVAVAKMWGRARLQGAAVALVTLADEQDRSGALYCFDLRHQHHRMMVLVFVPGATDIDFLDDVLYPVAVPARFASATKNETAVITSADEALTQILGWPINELVGQPTLNFIHPDDREVGIEAWMHMLEAPGPGRRVRLRHQHSDGRWVWLEVTNHNRLHDPEHGDVLCQMVDISEEMAANESLRAREQLLAQLTDTVPIGLFHASIRGEMLFANRRLQEVTGTAPCTTLEEQLAGVAPQDRASVASALRMATAGSDADVEFALNAGSLVRHCSMSVRPLLEDNGVVSGLTGCIEDITEVIRTRRALEVKAATDPLTGCLNREAILTSLQGFLDRPPPFQGASRLGTAVIFIDLDGFKAINDRLGHAAGDTLLVSLTSRVRTAIRSGDLIGRYGGDEFVVVCPDVTGPEQALTIADNLNQRAFHTIVSSADDDSPILASTGVAWTDILALPAARLIEAADAAMYRSKQAGRAQPVLAPPFNAHQADPRG